ncbi:MAG: hypothetical protein DRP49_03155 [Spirochaetes bacterium]|nr:MAG: hypothetical protein DRP49_03155 [Spirochaetota bacterium]
MPVPVSEKFHLININTGDRLRPGDVVSARIKAVLPNGRFRLYCNGRILTAKSSLTFRAGDLIRGRVEQTDRGLFLHLLTGGSKGNRDPSSLEMPRIMLFAALMRAGLPFSGDAEAQRRVALLNRTRGSQRRVARLYAELLAKGSDPGAAFLESVDGMLSGGGDGQGSKRWPSSPDSEELQGELCGDSAEDSETADKSDTLLTLISNVPGKNDTWMFKRLIRQLGEGELRMVWKIRHGINPALALTVYDGERTFEFLMEGLEKTQMAVYAGDGVDIDEKKWNIFRETLALMNVDVDDTLLPIGRSDGFTPGSDKAQQDLEGRV